MDVEKYFKLAEYCRAEHDDDSEPCDGCSGPIGRIPCPDDFDTGQWGLICAIRDHYEDMLKAEFFRGMDAANYVYAHMEREKVIAEVREWVETQQKYEDMGEPIRVNGIIKKLDSMEANKGDME